MSKELELLHHGHDESGKCIVIVGLYLLTLTLHKLYILVLFVNSFILFCVFMYLLIFSM